MLKKLWFQSHWLLGITAGIVLAVVGVTGALLSFEDKLLHAMNPGVMTVLPEDGAVALAPPVLLERVRSGQRVTAFTVSADAGKSVRVTFERGGTQYFDPYTGAALGTPLGADAFRQVRTVHRWLAAGEVGKQIVGASTIALIVSCLTGLYLRWPRNPLSLRAWLVVDFSRRGRAFLWSLHAALGTWVFIPYLLMATTGLYWSYDWYREGLFALTGAPRPVRPLPAGSGAGEPDLAVIWTAFQREAGEFRTASVRLPQRSGQPVQVNYLDGDPAHDRAFNRLTLHPASGAVLQHDRYASRTPGAKLMSSMLALHSGSFFGAPGRIALLLSSLLMPLFTITGWMLYLGRRARRRALVVARAANESNSAAA